LCINDFCRKREKEYLAGAVVSSFVRDVNNLNASGSAHDELLLFIPIFKTKTRMLIWCVFASSGAAWLRKQCHFASSVAAWRNRKRHFAFTAAAWRSRKRSLHLEQQRGEAGNAPFFYLLSKRQRD